MIDITISGPAASGKTTLAFALREFLRERGFDVYVNDAEITRTGRSQERNDECMAAIKDTDISITTIQTSKR